MERNCKSPPVLSIGNQCCIMCITGVKNACCTFLEKQLDSSNCLGIKVFAEQHSCENLWSAAESYGLKHFQDVISQEEFKTLPIDQVECLIKSDEIQVCPYSMNSRARQIHLTVRPAGQIFLNLKWVSGQVMGKYMLLNHVKHTQLKCY